MTVYSIHRLFKISCLLIVSLIIFSNCAPSRFVKPLQKNQSALGFSYGGALIKYSNAPIPMPFTTLCYAYGVSERTTLYGGVHVTSALFGNAQAEAGTTLRLYEKTGRFGFSLSPALQIAYNIRNATGLRAWPSIDMNYYQHFGNRASYAYVGFNSWIDFSKYKAHHEVQQTHVLPNIQLGYTFVKTKWLHQLELKYMGIGTANLPNVVDFIGISHQGSFGIFYSLVRKF